MHEIDDQRPIVLITGGSSGLGLACGLDLVTRETQGWRVIVASRDALAGRRAVQTLQRAAGHPCAEYLPLDLGDLADVRRFATAWRHRGLRLQALVCNAGLQYTAESRTRQGLEATFGINHLGHFALVGELASHLDADARIVVVSSGTHDPAQRTGMPPPRWVDPPLLAWPERDVRRAFAGTDRMSVVMRRRYTTSKLANLYFAYELHRRIASGIAGIPASVSVNAFDPGLMPGTGLARDYPLAVQLVWKGLLPLLRPLMQRFMMGGNVHSPAESGKALARLISSPDFAGVSGRYFEGRREIPSSPESYDQSRASELWAASTSLVHEWGLHGADSSLPPDSYGAHPRASRAAMVGIGAALLVAAALQVDTRAEEVPASPAGLWRTYGDDGSRPRGLVRLAERNGEVYGVLVRSLVPTEDPNRRCEACPGDRKNQSMQGLEFLRGLRRDGEAWVGGEILDPDSGRLYQARLTLQGQGRRLEVRGFVGVPLLGRSQTWERVE